MAAKPVLLNLTPSAPKTAGTAAPCFSPAHRTKTVVGSSPIARSRIQKPRSKAGVVHCHRDIQANQNSTALSIHRILPSSEQQVTGLQGSASRAPFLYLIVHILLHSR